MCGLCLRKVTVLTRANVLFSPCGKRSRMLFGTFLIRPRSMICLRSIIAKESTVVCKGTLNKHSLLRWKVKDEDFGKEKSLIRWALCLGLLAMVIIYGVRAEGVTGPWTEPDEKRPDVITIDSMKVFGNLERPAVIFLHDRHTEALSARGQDCSACHLKETDSRGQERLSIKYKRIQDNTRNEVMVSITLTVFSAIRMWLRKVKNPDRWFVENATVKSPT
jgi:hypothetical protein